MRTLLLTLLFTASVLSAQETVVKKNCEKVTMSFKMMSESTKINHKNLVMLTGILADTSADKEKKARAQKALEDMNEKTADRAKNSQYPAMHNEMKQAYIVNCGIFTAENNETINGLVERSIEYNNILAKTLGDKLSISKIK